MKFRKGFVSNSSSSSFLINLPEEVKTREQLEKLFKDRFEENDDGEEIYSGPYNERSKSEVLNFVEGLLEKPATDNDVLNELSEGIEIKGDDSWEVSYNLRRGIKPKYNKILRIDWHNFILKMMPYEYIEMLRRKEALKKYKKLLKTMKIPYVFSIEDSDNSDLEQGDFFGKYLINRNNHH